MDNTINDIVSQTVSGGGATSGTNVIDKLTQQILVSSDPSKWSGQGFGSAQANAADMAKIIAATGATDISQFGQIEKTVVDEDGNKSVEKTYGNKVTGQEVGNTYSERQTGNAFGGTFAGKGNTGYRVEFDPSGKPIFYTTGASSSDVPSWVKPALVLGGAYFGLDALGLLGAGEAATGLSALDAGAGVYGTTGAGLEFAGSGGAFDLANAGIIGDTGAGSSLRRYWTW